MGLAERLNGQDLSLKSTSQIKQDLNTLIQDFTRLNSNLKIILFGSSSNGTATVFSDIDLAVILDDQTDKKSFIKEFYKPRTLIKTPVDIIFRHRSEFNQKQTDNMIDQEIASTGVEIYPTWKLND